MIPPPFIGRGDVLLRRRAVQMLGGGHMVQWEDPERYNSILRDFLEELTYN